MQYMQDSEQAKPGLLGIEPQGPLLNQSALNQWTKPVAVGMGGGEGPILGLEFSKF